MSGILGFFELGLIVAAWWIFWSWFFKGLMARYPDSAAVQGLAAVLHA